MAMNWHSATPDLSFTLRKGKEGVSRNWRRPTEAIGGICGAGSFRKMASLVRGENDKWFLSAIIWLWTGIAGHFS